MYNTILFNGSLYNGNFNLGGILTSTEDISFNGFGLQNNNIITSNINVEDIERDFQTVPVPNGHGQILNSDFWRSKRIVISGVLTHSTRAQLEDLIFNFKKALSVQSKNFDRLMGDGSKRRWICTATNVKVDASQHYAITRATFSASFDVLVPFGQDTSYTAKSFTVSDLIFSEILENTGNAPANPVFILIITTADTVSAINIKNNTTNQEIEITETITAGDVLIFDSSTMTVTQNGTEIDFDGQFPILDPESNSYTITATGTSIAYELTAKTLSKYL
jgi:phage-related protein